jgi:prepilin-type N-terminal cleavage/methylation domain-containing protein
MKSKNGFTLVELSIVLVIIGLIVGGVVGGQALVQSAKSQKIIKEVREIQTAWNTFQLQYDALPGDFSEATDYWPTSTYSWMENGDGNGKLQWASQGAPSAEPMNSFEHLIVSEILNGYLGNLSMFVVDENRYSSDVFSNSHYRIEYGNNLGNRLVLLISESFTEPILTPAQTLKIDKTLDDGQPRTGRFRASASSAPDAPVCYDSDTSYNLDETRDACYFLMTLD